jgi:type I restriction enzyme S subunit
MHLPVAFSLEARKAVMSIRRSEFPVVPLFGDAGICKQVIKAPRTKRHFVSKAFGIPFISSSEICSLRPELKGYLSKKLTKKIDEFIIREWDVLISRSGTVGNIGFAGARLAGVALSEDAMRLRTDRKEEAGFIVAFLRSWIGRAQVQGIVYGSVVQHIEPEHLTRIYVPGVHPIQRIEIGSKFVEAVKARDKSNELLDEADKCLHIELGLPYLDDMSDLNKKTSISKVKFSDINLRLDAHFHNPCGREAMKRLKAHSQGLTVIGDPSMSSGIWGVTKFRKRVYVETGGIPFYSSKQFFQYAPIDIKRLAKGAHLKDLQEIQLQKDMILITRSGTIGRVQIVPEYMEGWAGSEHAIRVVATAQTNPGYLYSWLSSDYGHSLITRYSHGSVILEIDRHMISEIPIPIVSDQIQNKIGNLVFEASALRTVAWKKEQEAIQQVEKLVVD